jgi:hypothetical protein
MLIVQTDLYTYKIKICVLFGTFLFLFHICNKTGGEVTSDCRAFVFITMYIVSIALQWHF